MPQSPRNPGDRDFEKYFAGLHPDEDLKIDDADFESLMRDATRDAGRSEPARDMEPGTLLTVQVVGVREGELLVELDAKHHGAIDLAEYQGHEVPETGSVIQARFVRRDHRRELVILTVSEVRRELFWDSLEVGQVYEVRVTGQQRGGYVVDVGGARGFMPEREVAADAPADLVGQVHEVEVIRFDRADRDVVVSSRRIRERERGAERQQHIARLEVGDVRSGRVVRLNEHGAFVDIGEVEGLVHASKLHRHQRREGGVTLKEGDSVRVEIVHVDVERERVGLDLSQEPVDCWGELTAQVEVGEEMYGAVQTVDESGVHVLIDEQVTGVIPADALTGPLPRAGDMLRVCVHAIDAGRRRVELRVAGGTA